MVERPSFLLNQRLENAGQGTGTCLRSIDIDILLISLYIRFGGMHKHVLDVRVRGFCIGYLQFPLFPDNRRYNFNPKQKKFPVSCERHRSVPCLAVLWLSFSKHYPHLTVLRILGHQPSIAHFQHGVGGFGHGWVVGDDHHAAALLMGQAPENLHDVPAVLTVQIAGGLVG